MQLFRIYLTDQGHVVARVKNKQALLKMLNSRAKFISIGSHIINKAHIINITETI